MNKQGKELAVTERRIYHPESRECSDCGEPIKLCAHYQWRKNVQHLTGAVYVASRGGACANPACVRVNQLVTSVVAQSVTVPGCTYGLDIIAQIGWWRDREHQDRAEIHRRLVGYGVQLSERQVDYLYQHYQILLACVGDQDRSRLDAVVEAHGGLKICLDGLAPEGASEQLWVVREVESQTTLVVAWLDKVNHETLQTLLRPVEALGLPILATVSDKQPCVKKALEALWPTIPHQWCQPHYLGNLADPIYDRDRMLKTEMRQTIRDEIRASVAEVLNDADESAVHFVAGVALNPASATDQPAPQNDEPPDDEPPSSGLASVASSTTNATFAPSQTPLDDPVTSTQQPKTRPQIVRDFALDLKEALARQGRAPFICAGLPMLDDLTALLDTLMACLACGEDPHLRHWADVLTRILPDFAADFAAVAQARQWVQDISTILAGPKLLMCANSPIIGPAIPHSYHVKTQFTALLKHLEELTDLDPFLAQFRHHLVAITQRYWSGLFHCYDIPGLTSSNNALESLFGQTKRQLRRRLGIHHLREALRRHAPWALLDTDAASPEELTAQFQAIDTDDFRAQRALFEARLQQLLHRFRWRHRRDKLLQQRLTDWANAASTR